MDGLNKSYISRNIRAGYNELIIIVAVDLAGADTPTHAKGRRLLVGSHLDRSFGERVGGLFETVIGEVLARELEGLVDIVELELPNLAVLSVGLFVFFKRQVIISEPKSGSDLRGIHVVGNAHIYFICYIDTPCRTSRQRKRSDERPQRDRPCKRRLHK